MASVIWAGFAGLFLVAAAFDSRTYRIPNWISLALVGLFVVAVLVSGERVTAFWPHLALGLAILVVGYLLYQFTGMGAGDAKLAASAVLWTGFSALYAWTFYLALSMAALALGLVIVRQVATVIAGAGTKPRILQRGAPVPLGVAIAAATILASGSFDPALWSI